MITISRKVAEEAKDYVAALIEACDKAQRKSGKPIEPAHVIMETDQYPQVVKAIDQAEFLVGWFHGVAAAYGVEPDALWRQLAPEPATPPVKTPRAPRPPKVAREPAVAKAARAIAADVITGKAPSARASKSPAARVLGIEPPVVAPPAPAPDGPDAKVIALPAPPDETVADIQRRTDLDRASAERMARKKRGKRPPQPTLFPG